MSLMRISGHWHDSGAISGSKRILLILILFLILLSVFSPIGASRSTPKDEPIHNSTRATNAFDFTDAPEWLEVQAVILFEQPDWMSIDINYQVHEILLTSPYGQTTADELRTIYDIERQTGANNPPILSALYQKIDEISRTIVNNSTKSSTQIYYDPTRDISSFIGTIDENQYDPPIVVNQYVRIKLSELAYFTPEELDNYNIKNLHDLLDGALKMGARLTQDITLYAGAGYFMTYIIKVETYDPFSINAQDQLVISHPDNDFSAKTKDKVKFIIDNLNSLYSSVRTIKNLALRNKEPNVQTNEIIQYDINLNLMSFDELEINRSRFEINSIKLKGQLQNLPSNISDIHFLSTDGLRLFLDNGLIQISDLESGLSSEFQRLENQLAKVFNTTSSVVFEKEWDFNTIFELEPLYYLHDSGSIKRMGAGRPITGDLFAREVLQPRLFGNVSTVAIEGLLNTGAMGKLDIFISIPYSYSYTFSLPPGFELIGQTPLEPEVPAGVGYSYLLKSKQRQTLTLASLKHPRYTASFANVNVDIDIYEVEIQSLSEYVASVKISANGKLHYIKNEPGSKFDNALPKGITMDYYNSDALRLVYTEGLLDIEEIEEDLYSMIKENISNLLKEDVKMNVSFNDELLIFDGDTNNMDGSDPVKFSIRSSGKMRITSERNVRLGAFVTKRLELPLPGVKYWNVTYKLILPEHIQILGQPDVINGSVEYSGPIVDRNSENRDELIITIYGEPGNSNEYRDETLEVNVEVDIDITLWFFLSKIIIPIILFMILCILIVLIKVYRSHKIKKIDKLREDPELIHEEKSGTPSTPWSLDGTQTSDRRTALKSKDSHINMMSSDDKSSDDYTERLEELMPRHAMRSLDKGKGKGKRMSMSKSKGRGKLTRGMFTSRHKRGKRGVNKKKGDRSNHEPDDQAYDQADHRERTRTQTRRRY